MARLLIKNGGVQNQIVELKLGANFLGSSPDNDFTIDHPTVSAVHCQIILSEGELLLRDCNSTNGTFVRGELIKETSLASGQTFCLGEVEILVESTDVKIAIPKFEIEHPPTPVMLEDGSMLCCRHPRARVTHQCTHCHELLCDACIHRMRRRGGKVLKLCPLCSSTCEPLVGEKPKKRSLLGLFRKTVKLPFARKPRNRE